RETEQDVRRLDGELAEARQQAVTMSAPPLANLSAEDVEIYVLSRLANARSVGRFGALPMVFVEPFAALGPVSSHPILDLLGRMAGAVQVVFLTEDPSVLAWAHDQ